MDTKYLDIIETTLPQEYQKTAIECFYKGFDEGKAYIEPSEVRTSVFILLGLWLLTIILTWNIASNKATTKIVPPVEILIERYEADTGKKLSEWRRNKIKEDCENIDPSEWERIVTEYGDEITK